MFLLFCSIPRAEILHRWKLVMIFLLGNTLACISTTGILNFVDRKRVSLT